MEVGVASVAGGSSVVGRNNTSSELDRVLLGNADSAVGGGTFAEEGVMLTAEARSTFRDSSSIGRGEVVVVGNSSVGRGEVVVVGNSSTAVELVVG